MTGRNDPCPCGSGKKLKRCCIDKPVDYGPCVECEAAGHGVHVCKLCDKRYAYCRTHSDASQTTMRGHVIRVHPESVPHMVDKLIRNPAEIAAIRDYAKHEPELWKRFFEYIAERQN